MKSQSKEITINTGRSLRMRHCVLNYMPQSLASHRIRSVEEEVLK